MSHNITINGYISDTPEVRQVNAKRDVLVFTIASTRKWKDGNGADQESTEFFNCVCYRERGKFNNLMAKGRFAMGTEVRVNRCYMETKKNETPEKTYYNTQFVVDGMGNINSPALEIVSTKAERAFLRQAKEQGMFDQNQQPQHQQAA